MRSVFISVSLFLAWILLGAAPHDAVAAGKPQRKAPALRRPPVVSREIESAAEEIPTESAEPAAIDEPTSPASEAPQSATEASELTDPASSDVATETEEQKPAARSSIAARVKSLEKNKPEVKTPDEPARVKPESADDEEAPEAPGGSLLERIKQAAVPIHRPEPAEFHGVRAGRTTLEELQKAWGAPLETSQVKDVIRQTYRLEALDRIDVHCYRDVVQSIVVHYSQHPAWADLSREIGLEKIEPVDVEDEFGELMGVALPDAGAIVGFESSGKERRVAQVIYEAIDPQAFVLRAEQRMTLDYTGCQKDLELALVVDPQYSRAYWLRARVLRSLGQIDAAAKAADAALKLEPKNAQYQLTRAALWADAGQYPKAIEQTKRALTFCQTQPELKACVLNQLGEQLAAGPGRAYKAALPLHMQAIKLAEPLVEDRHVAVRQTAQEALLDAHLAAARNIAWGNWKMKKKMVPTWLNRAEELADDMASQGESKEPTLRVCRDALSACVGMEGDLDPTPWAERLVSLSTPALESISDPLRKRQLQWDLGASLYDALQVFHAKGETQQALKVGTLAVEYLEAGAADRQLEPVEAYLLGRLYYRMGAVYAVHEKDPEEAVTWFERAIPLLERPVPVAALADVGRHGESFVSMAVSYWSAGSHEEAMRLTRQGVKIMERAVKEGTLEESVLRVPYTNLATMHRFLGDDEQADAFRELAARASGGRRR